MEGRSFNERFPAIVSALENLEARNVILDGELAALEPTGRPNFNETQNSSRTKLPIHYIVFDVLHLNGESLLDVPLEQRKTILDDLGRLKNHLKRCSCFPTKSGLAPVFHDDVAAGGAGSRCFSSVPLRLFFTGRWVTLKCCFGKDQIQRRKQKECH
jgi:hypothetical protein